jgi:hypothetical protein
MNNHDRKNRFISLLNNTKLMINDPNILNKWFIIIKTFKKMSSEELNDRFHFNNLYKLDFMLDPIFGDFHIRNMPILKQHIQNKAYLEMINEIDNTLTDQMSNILPKILILHKLVDNKDNIQTSIDDLYDFIYSKRYHSCILKELIDYYG